MKKYILTLSIFTLIGVTSCSDKELELGPYNSVTDTQAFETESDFTNAAQGMYARAVSGLSGLSGGSYYAGSSISLPDIMSDNAIMSRTGRLSNRFFHEWRYNGDNAWDLWTQAYSSIRRANGILVNINKLSDGTAKNNFKGEALAVRALAHFDMVKLYGKAFTQASDADLGIPYVTSTDPTARPARETVKSNYAKIEADLVEAATLIGSGNGIYRFNKATVYALLSRLYLYEGQWQKAADSATQSLALSSSPGSITNFANIWKDASNDGLLLKLQIVDKDAVSPGVEYSQSSASGVRSEYVIDYDFFKLYKDNDVRKNAYIGSSTFGGFKYNNIIKYFGRATGNANVVDPKVIRVAEVLLNRAEALAQLNKDADALKDLNTLRASRYVGFVAADNQEGGNALKAEIDLQRRLELAFEGHRFFDIKRKGLAIVRSNWGDRFDGTGTTYGFKTLAAGDPKFQLPIPTNEIRTNANVVQNPGY
ncbi:MULTISPECIES: RagB/SusD family nutrient uptake outer membrane protein [unclassified Arcicella]|uniref:RagB/SusD family nutrient uptake outer membrane protein n=1 Tax=unclassified Arcicella TaxID=2644986 RepID=UPI002858D7B7|nr:MULTISPECIES: RagB/SusD family nutrient uptake outer membrane protein [unclassified Arcicella]MDR6560561.1 tetratricopeptide (TPR) repeat protein [Arcicella sp. BE51]MDR6809833.1 tetratricopeptide (TPR) repeat protein [Arcicella sp. BE140]MDR6821182.1 tetratricopeptide (TPR) repeat protein [Arcicella sp. BE139]